MRMSHKKQRYVGQTAPTRREPNCPFMWRQFLVGAIAFGVAGCSAFTEEAPAIPKGTVGFVQGVIGGVATDEPRATLIARDILAAGGSAADAAVAAFFTMTVTLPSSVSLGGGGICLVRDHVTNTVETLDFRVKPSKANNFHPDAAAVPGSPRGVFALHAKYGSLKWEELIRPAENLARFGTEVSRALGQDLKVSLADIWLNPDLRDLFSAPDSDGPFKEGEFIKQVNLSTTLALIRSKGASELYLGPFARQLAEDAQATGMAFTYDELRSYLPEWRKTITVPFIQGTEFHFPAPPGLAGGTTALTTAMVAFRDLYENLDSIGRAHLLAEAIERSLADRPRWQNGNIEPEKIASLGEIERLMDNFDRTKHIPVPTQVSAPTDSLAKSRGASISVMDRNGSAVACSFTMNKPFGVGRVAKGTGMVLAAPPATAEGEGGLASIMLVNKLGNSIFFAASATGGAAAPSALVNVMANGIANADGDLETAMLSKRIHHGGADGTTYLEKGMNTAIVNGLGELGHKMAYVRTLGYVNAVFCSTGIPNKDGPNCAVRSDQRGFGLGVGSD